MEEEEEETMSLYIKKDNLEGIIAIIKSLFLQPRTLTTDTGVIFRAVTVRRLHVGADKSQLVSTINL